MGYTVLNINIPVVAEMDLEIASRLLDAASCITVVRQKRTTERGYTYRLSMLVRRWDEIELKEMVRALGVDGHIAPIKTRGVPYFQLVWQGKSAVEVLDRAKPWLNTRAREAELVIKFWHEGDFAQLKRGPVSEEIWGKRDAIYAEIRALKAELAGRDRLVSSHRDLTHI